MVGGAPNVSKLLDRGGVEYVQRTGGGFKRTINLLTPNTDEGLRKFEEEIQQIHVAFASHVSEHRPVLAGDASTGHAAPGWSPNPLSLSRLRQTRVVTESLLSAAHA